MSKKIFLAVGFFTLNLAFSTSPLAAPNTDLAALSRASVVQFTGTERISQPFVFDLDVTVANPALNLANIVGQPLKVTMAKDRTVAGIIEHIEQSGVTGPQGRYHVRLVPALKRLAYRINSRTFVDMNAVQIVNTVMNDAGISDLEIRLSNSVKAQDISVQYQESEFTYFSRLLEQEGIHYHFEPSGAGAKTVLGDSNTAFPVLSPGQLVFASPKGLSITSFSQGLALHSGRTQAGDFNWKNPNVNLTTTAQSPLFLDLVEGVFPAPVETLQESQQYSAIRLGARISDGQSCGGTSTYMHMQAGYRFSLSGHLRKDFNQEYVITSVEHHGTPKGYHNTFSCLPAHIIFRPSPETPQPKIAGVLPGIVVGPQGEVKHVDEFGRVRVRFPWRNPAFSNNDGSGDSGWVRVAQIATGVGTTSMWIPDVGDEVLVVFEHGDPNRPVVIGSMWNGKDMPPSSLPANKFRSIFQGRSASGGINEIVLDDTSGQERLILRSGNQFIQLSPNGITATSTITTPSATRQRLQPPTGLKSPSFPIIPKR
ncbi:MAG: type VI secretion system tip protein TssI/VgrG [Nitrospirales bacterium]